jgi:serine/threonine protein kinase
MNSEYVKTSRQKNRGSSLSTVAFGPSRQFVDQTVTSIPQAHTPGAVRATLAPGALLGLYQVDSLVGKGGMGEVYRARDTRLNRDIALKVLPPPFSSNPERVARFTQEARTTALLNHPNIVAVYDVGSHEGLPFVVSEFLHGETLRKRLAAGALPLTTVMHYAIEVARGLSAAHQLGVVHRDLKPENIFVTRDGRVKILDFGLARRGDQGVVPPWPESSITTSPGTVLGTVGYMSPEQVAGFCADNRSDIFSLGIVVYEMVCGTAPFHRASAVETLNAILKEEPITLRRYRRRAPQELETVVRHCLEKDRDARFQTVRDLIFSLELVLRAVNRSDQRATTRKRDRRASNGTPKRGFLASLRRLV